VERVLTTGQTIVELLKQQDKTTMTKHWHVYMCCV